MTGTDSMQRRMWIKLLPCGNEEYNLAFIAQNFIFLPII